MNAVYALRILSKKKENVPDIDVSFSRIEGRSVSVCSVRALVHSRARAATAGGGDRLGPAGSLAARARPHPRALADKQRALWARSADLLS